MAGRGEDIFMKLSKNAIQDIIGILPTPPFEIVSYSVVDDVLQYLLGEQKPYKLEEELTNIEFEEKIKFNRLGGYVEKLLISASYQHGTLERFFNRNNAYIKDKISHKFKEIYNKGKQQSDFANDNDALFFYILKKASPQENKQVEDAVLVLMSYFFEACDIYEHS